jgi:hypothetical protein
VRKLFELTAAKHGVSILRTARGLTAWQPSHLSGCDQVRTYRRETVCYARLWTAGRVAVWNRSMEAWRRECRASHTSGQYSNRFQIKRLIAAFSGEFEVIEDRHVLAAAKCSGPELVLKLARFLKWRSLAPAM